MTKTVQPVIANVGFTFAPVTRSYIEFDKTYATEAKAEAAIRKAIAPFNDAGGERLCRYAIIPTGDRFGILLFNTNQNRANWFNAVCSLPGTIIN